MVKTDKKVLERGKIRRILILRNKIKCVNYRIDFLASDLLISLGLTVVENHVHILDGCGEGLQTVFVVVHGSRCSIARAALSASILIALW